MTHPAPVQATPPHRPLIDDGDFASCPCGCGETFPSLDSRGRPRKFFSPGCSLRVNNYMRMGLGNPFAGRKHTEATRKRLSEKASVPKPWIRGDKNGMAGRKGPLNPRYVDGSSPERQRAYASTEWRELVRVVRARDGYRCTQCGAEKRGRRSLHLHHIKPWAGNPESRFDPNNILTLCADCHHAAHAKGGASSVERR